MKNWPMAGGISYKSLELVIDKNIERPMAHPIVGERALRS